MTVTDAMPADLEGALASPARPGLAARRARR